MTRIFLYPLLPHSLDSIRFESIQVFTENFPPKSLSRAYVHPEKWTLSREAKRKEKNKYIEADDLEDFFFDWRVKP